MSEHQFDIGIIGCGPAGLSAAVNAKNKNRDIVVLGAEICSPPLHKAPLISNYLGFPSITGEELRQSFLGHASMLGIEIIKSKADNVFPDDDGYLIISQGRMIRAKTVIICTGIPYRNTLQNESDFLGKGLGYCATCDGPLYRGKDVAIVGYSEEAEPEANYLSEICSQVYYLPLYKKEPAVAAKVKVVRERPLAVEGDEAVKSLKTNKSQLPVDGIFIVGAETSPERLVPGLELNENFIKVNRNMETNLPGIFAAGDCTGPPYQLSKSTGEGQIAALNATKMVLKMKS
ncbi:MAG: NAD(P)/FAD-dependent oxidoreductase [Syntrophomonadales bacterium]